MHNKVYLLIFGGVFLIATIVFDCFPRSTFSPLEKRKLDSVPEFTLERLFDGSYTRDVSHWFSDSEPFRDELLSFSMNLKNAASISAGSDEDNITFHESEGEKEEEKVDDNRTVADYENNVNAGEMAKVAMRGIIIVGSGPKVRAIMAYGGGPEGGTHYSDVANLYKQTFGDKVNVYCMTIPTSAEFYCPTKAQSRTSRQLPTIRNINAHLDPKVQAVDVYTALAQHVKEDIYLRTDHHWAPLGAYYAAQQFAKVARVPFKELDSCYTRHVIHGYVGSMYGYSKDASVKNAPEDFVYYMPKDSSYTTTYISYRANKDFQITSESAPTQGKFFRQYKDGSPNAYCTFMGGDQQLTVVRTGVKNGRRLLILKDSFGNALPGYLFYSFEEVHVVDFRYFNKNLKRYVPDNKITDILFAFNIYNAYGAGSCSRLANYLTQGEGIQAHADAKADKKTDAKSDKKADKKADGKKASEAKSDKKADDKKAEHHHSDKKPEAQKAPEAKKTDDKKTEHHHSDKSADTKTSDAKKAETKTSDSKKADTKADSKKADSKSADSKKTDSKKAETTKKVTTKSEPAE